MTRPQQRYFNQPLPWARLASPGRGGGAGRDSFWGVVYDKIEVEIDWELDPLFYGVCRGPDFPMFRGEYSFFEVVEDTRIDRHGYFTILEGGRSGVAGQCDALHEINRANVNIHLNRMVVRIWIGGSVEIMCESSEQVSSSQDYLDSTDIPVDSFDRRYWFDLGLPREDCARPYIIAAAPGNDFPPPP